MSEKKSFFGKLFSSKKAKVEPEIIYSPIKGKAVKLSEVPDPVFAENMMGDGLAVIPEEGVVYAPFDGKVILHFDKSKHAIGLRSDNGIEVLVHVGIDTVNITGPCFEYHTALEQSVKKGEKVMSFDLAAIEKNGCPIITPIIITDSEKYKNVEVITDADVTNDSVIFKITKQ